MSTENKLTIALRSYQSSRSILPEELDNWERECGFALLIDYKNFILKWIKQRKFIYEIDP